MGGPTVASYIRQFLLFFCLFSIFYLVFFPAPQPPTSRVFGQNNDGRLKPFAENEKEAMPVTKNSNFLEAAGKWKTCFADQLKTVRSDAEGMWYWIRKATNECRNKTVFSKIELTGIKNKDEMKYHIYDKSDAPAVVVTMGIGLDVKAETKLKETLPKGSRFYGADPIFRGNADLFDPIGPFFPFAVGKDIAVSAATVLHNGKYKNMTMPHIDIITFITKYVNEKVIDQLLMDNEGPEYDILPMMAKGKEFDENGIVICQVNTEVHNANKLMKEQFLQIMNTIIEDGRYAFMVSYATVHHRFFFINIEHPYCVDRYYSRFFE